MRSSLQMALLLGVVTFAMGSVPGVAQQAAEGPLQGMVRDNQRGADRLEREFDVNRDGRITHDELNRTIGARFAAATHHAAKMSADIFMTVRAESFRQNNIAAFHRLDWNGDGKLTLAEYGMPQRMRFAAMDRNGAGWISCVTAGLDGAGGRGGGLSRFCTDNDLNLDGKVTRSELDTALAKRFAQVTGGSQSMNETQFVLSEQQRYAGANVRLFRRLDEDGDGMLTVEEFGATELKLFAKLDKNKDGVLGPGELHARTARGSRGNRVAYNQTED